jgi:hydroxyacylglutathione hydrolase
MGLVLERINSPGLAQLSYLVGDTAAGVAAVIDPRRDVDVYLERARQLGLRIQHIVETHIHADFVSGAHELQARIGAPIYGGQSSDYQFEYQPLQDGDRLTLGNISLTAVHTPGHTPEHISLLVADAKQGDASFGLFTGDFVFNLDVGRPDLLGGGTEKRLAAQLYHSIFDILLPMGDRLEIYPCHGAGSACGKAIGDRQQSTIGNERLFNSALQQRSENEFIEWLLGDMPEPPRHYARLKQVNAKGAPVRGCLQTPPPLSVSQFQEQMEDESTVVVDTRSMLAFGGGHMPGAVNIGLGASFPTWAGWILDPEQAILLVVDDPQDLQRATEDLFRLGFDNVRGYLHDGMTSWQLAGLPLRRILQMTVEELNRVREQESVTVLDVRTDQEFLAGAVPDAHHVFLPHLTENLDPLEPANTIATYCGSGYRSSIAASLLQKHGFPRVVNIPGAWGAWQSADLPVKNPDLAAV